VVFFFNHLKRDVVVCFVVKDIIIIWSTRNMFFLLVTWN
jgi:hypothetical protein